MSAKIYPDRRAGARARYAANPSKFSERAKASRQKNSSHVKQRDKKYRGRYAGQRKAQWQRWYSENRDRVNAKKRAIYAEDPELFAQLAREKREQDPEAARVADKKWKNNHREATRAQGRRRRALKKRAPVNDLTHDQWLEIQAAQDHRCYYCGKRRKGKLTQDHIVPLSKGGSHTVQNVIAACHSCNSRKGTRKPPIPVQPLLLTVAPAKKKRRVS